MENKLRKIYYAILLIWGIIAGICTIIFAFLFNSKEALDADANLTAFAFFNVGYYTTVIFLVISILAIVVFAIYYLAKAFMYDPKKAMGTLVGLVALVIVFIVSYVISPSTDISVEAFNKVNLDPSYSKLVGSGLIATYILFGGVFIALIYAQIAKKLK